jgi:hypothetical protein
MATAIKSETNLKSLETIAGNYKLVSEVRLNNKNEVQQLSGQITGENNQYIANYSGNENNGKLMTNISVQDNVNRTICNELFDGLLADIGQLFPII